ncbi:uncharacterized protein LOC130720004 [Lotus japonicus]|uniref:uncharacterized protein LOC130720004 n=1 Tax=Lotus japonicus TaxID=34305 RepID=UPI00258F5486|nr:uncharacterized protein LOC130720004 [Lotus japonicus]
MATLQKFKLFALQCGAVQSPTRSPMVQLPRPKTTLRALLGLSLTRPPRRREDVPSAMEKEKDSQRRQKLKDLFVSSPPREEEEERSATPLLGSVAAVGIGVGNSSNMGLARSGSWRGGPGSMNPVWTGFRCRSLLKRKAWRPLLNTITE